MLFVKRKLFFVTFSLSIISVLICNAQINEDASAISFIRIHPTNYELIRGKNIVYSINDTVSVFSVNKATIYKLSAKINFNTSLHIKGTEAYFIHEKGEKFGYRFKTIIDRSIGDPFQADSFIYKYAVAEVGLSYPKQNTNTYSSKYIINETNDQLIKKFYFESKTQEEIPDTVFYYFSKRFPKTDITLSRSLDSIEGMKLTRFEIFYKEGYSSEIKSVLPIRRTVYELMNIESGIPPEVYALYEHFLSIHKPHKEVQR